MLVAVTSRDLGLAAVAAVFIAFAVASAFVLPRRDPAFPGRRLPLYVGATIVLFVAMIAAVWTLAGEEKRGRAEAVETQPATTGGETTGSGETQPAAGDPVAGKRIFAATGCGSCHTLQAAGASGTIGPNLDERKPSFDLVVERVTNGKPPMPAFKGQLSAQQIRDVAAYVVESTKG